MGFPRRNSRKGRMEAVQRLASAMGREWRPYNSQWQPSTKLRIDTQLRIQALREALDDLEQSL